MISASFTSSNCRSEVAVGGRRAAIRSANFAGGTYPKLLCGRSSLYSSFHAMIFRRASNKFPNQFAFKHSSRNFPWKLSTCAFCTGRPGSVCTRSRGEGQDQNKRKAPGFSPGAFRKRELTEVWFYRIPEPLLELADLAFGSRFRIPSVAETATTDPSRRVPTTGK